MTRPVLGRKNGVALRSLQFAGLLLLVVATVVGVGITRFGSMGHTLAAIRGEIMLVDSLGKTFGVIDEGETAHVDFGLTNLSSEPIRILGSTTTCACTAPPDLPMSIEPHSTKTLRVTVHVATNTVKGKASEILNQDLIIYTNVASRPRMILTISGEIRAVVASTSLSKAEEDVAYPRLEVSPSDATPFKLKER